MTLVSLPLAALVIYHIHDTSYQDEKTMFADDAETETAEVNSGAAEKKEVPPEWRVTELM